MIKECFFGMDKLIFSMVKGVVVLYNIFVQTGKDKI